MKTIEKFCNENSGCQPYNEYNNAVESGVKHHNYNTILRNKINTLTITL
jgi:hypothetical protein